MSQERDNRKSIDSLAFGILAWIEKRPTFGVWPKVYEWPHASESKATYKKLRKECALHFGIDLDTTSGSSKSDS